MTMNSLTPHSDAWHGDALQRRAFDLALVEVWLPGLNGIELLVQLRDIAPDMQEVVIIRRPTCTTAVLALRPGACDYVRVQKPLAQANLPTVVRRALAGGCLPADEEGRWASEQLARARPWLAEVGRVWAELTERERQVLTELAAGRRDAEIAELLGISIKTAGHHVSNLLSKLGVGSRTEAAVWAVRAGVRVANRENSPRENGEQQFLIWPKRGGRRP